MSLSHTTTSQIGSFKKTMRTLYVVLAWLFALCILIQVFLAGLSIFSSATYWRSHISFAHLFEYLPFFLFLLALLGRLPRAITLLSLLLVVQFALQYAFIESAGSLGIAVLAAFHPVNPIIMFWIALYIARRASAHTFSRAPAQKHQQRSINREA